jgi:AcrR family transcriptional regulator
VTDIRLPRAERRRNTEQRILDAARASFAEHGFERTTIRAIAAVAKVDPALVMQYFGSKQALFKQAARITPSDPLAEGPEHLTELLLSTLGLKIGELPEASLAMMRSMLTHPEAAETARSTLDQQIEQISAAIPAEDARVRAALIMATMVGVTISHQLLSLDALRDASPEQIASLLRPCFQVLTGSPVGLDRPDSQVPSSADS